MKLKTVKIYNFRQYRDVEIDFAREKDRSFTVIRGNNGTGKTTLLNALSWCLYGNEIHDYGDKSTLNICNNKSAFLAENNQTITVSVEMEFDDDNKILIFKRSQNFHKYQGELRKDSGLEFEVFEQDENDVKISAQDAYIIERKIPKEIEEYFFFDGALLTKYFSDSSSKKIKDSIFELSQLNLILEMGNHLDKLIAHYNKTLKKIAPTLGEASTKLSEKQKLKNNKLIELEEANRTVSEVDKRLKKIDNELLDINSGKVLNLVKEDLNLQEDIEKLGKEINELESERKKLILETYPLLFSYDLLQNFLEISKDANTKKFIPAKYKKSFLEDLLTDGKCICGVDLEKHQNLKENLEILYNKTPRYTNESEKLAIATNEIKNLILEVKKFKPKIKKIKMEVNEKNETLDKKLKRSQNIQSKLKSNPIEKIQKLQEEKESLYNIRKNNNIKIGSVDKEIERINEDIKFWNQKKNQEAKDRIEVQKLDEKINFVENSKNAVNNIHNQLSEHIHNKVESFTKEKFIKIQWKKDEFIDIKIDDNYNVSIINKIGEIENPSDLSDGEKLCLGLCFMSALHNIAGFDLPIIMDTPLGTLDKDIRQNIAKFLPEFVQNNQTVLLVTGTEYTDDFRDILYDHVGKEYIIEWNNSEEGKESKVIQYGGK
ncbi:AAA family ATPase [Methanobrevibacter curvatus]|uniref:Chromosome partition protein Smc n=1 Tax=Methanobrevibacter curvatus TaxID=49547 RepID=A0A162FGS8_9EURY|nr:AAA family ATPase [Methanobrevibacter curvatus]KZX12815.1 chromosome partition protein Smc [Methanobrevibacter curvatus]